MLLATDMLANQSRAL